MCQCCIGYWHMTNTRHTFNTNYWHMLNTKHIFNTNLWHILNTRHTFNMNYWHMSNTIHSFNPKCWCYIGTLFSVSYTGHTFGFRFFVSFFLVSNHFSFLWSLLIFYEGCIFTFSDMFFSFVSKKPRYFSLYSFAVM